MIVPLHETTETLLSDESINKIYYESVRSVTCIKKKFWKLGKENEDVS